MGLQDLPKPGSKFRAKTGLGNFFKKIKRVTKHGEFKGLKDNINPIVETMREFQGVIRKKGGLDRLQRRKAWKKIKEKSKKEGINITLQDARDIQDVLEHFDPDNRVKNDIGTMKKDSKSKVSALATKKTRVERNSLISTILGKKEKERPLVARYLRALDTSYEDEKNKPSTGVSIESIRKERRGVSKLKVDTSKSNSQQSGINPLTGGVATARRSGSMVRKSSSNKRLSVNPLSGGTTRPARPIGNINLNTPSASAPPKLPPNLAI